MPNPVTATDLYATIKATVGVSPKTELFVEGRPFHVADHGKGRPVAPSLGALSLDSPSVV